MLPLLGQASSWPASAHSTLRTRAAAQLSINITAGPTRLRLAIRTRLPAAHLRLLTLLLSSHCSGQAAFEQSMRSSCHCRHAYSRSSQARRDSSIHAPAAAALWRSDGSGRWRVRSQAAAAAERLRRQSTALPQTRLHWSAARRPSRSRTPKESLATPSTDPGGAEQEKSEASGQVFDHEHRQGVEHLRPFLKTTKQWKLRRSLAASASLGPTSRNIDRANSDEQRTDSACIAAGSMCTSPVASTTPAANARPSAKAVAPAPPLLGIRLPASGSETPVTHQLHV